MAGKKTDDDGTVKLSAVKPAKDAGPVAKVVAAPKAAVVKPVIVAGSDSGQGAASAGGAAKGRVIKKQDFFERILKRGDMKKNQIKPGVEAALEVISDALLAGEELHLPPLGKLKVQNVKDVGGGAKALTLKLRTPKEF
ncbi:HU family DNA-binding protein [Yoonia sp. 208BN28-4]|uniref:HU family DNA-binding protein n=1 Tax=Yoonia sp. 208BN28-4 TaxID=3126505 RepID=UPI0030AAAD9A